MYCTHFLTIKHFLFFYGCVDLYVKKHVRVMRSKYF